MKYLKVDSQDALLLVRSMGLLLNQAAVYGPVHNVTKCAIARVYQEMVEQLEQYRALEFTVKNNLICINGLSGNVDPVVSSNLLRRFSQLDISGVLFSHPLSAKEFEKGIKILALPAAVVSEAGGVAELFKHEEVRSVTVVRVDYQRVDKDSSASKDPSAVTLRVRPIVKGEQAPPASKDTPALNPLVSDPPPVSVPRAPAKATQGWGSGVIDLSDNLLERAARAAGAGGDAPQEELPSRRIEHKRQVGALAALLRETATTLETSSKDNPKEQLGQVMGVLEQVKAALRELTRGSQSAITSLARNVDEDRMMVASIEAEATSRGFPLKLTREELLARYAELNQEIIQPLTVSTGVIEMLHKEQLGAMTPSQQEMLRLAQESIDRVNQLVSYMRGVAGMPVSLSPDRDVIDESYGTPRG
ncbi:MAG: hypothetical protein WC340_09390 [Kiritimatiellia bacterium]